MPKGGGTFSEQESFTCRWRCSTWIWIPIFPGLKITKERLHRDRKVNERWNKWKESYQCNRVQFSSTRWPQLFCSFVCLLYRLHCQGEFCLLPNPAHLLVHLRFAHLPACLLALTIALTQSSSSAGFPFQLFYTQRRQWAGRTQGSTPAELALIGSWWQGGNIWC